MSDTISFFLIGANVTVIYRGVPHAGRIVDYDMAADEYTVHIDEAEKDSRYGQVQLREWNPDYVKGK